MAYTYITPENVFDRWAKSKTYTDRLTDPFPEYQRIARNEPYSGSDPNYPNVTDGTTASIIQKTPKRVVQQLPTGVVESDDGEEWLHILAGFIYLKKILPYANEDYDLFEKAQLIIENGLTFGSGASYAPFINHDGYFCPDMTLPYWGDIYLQPGKKSGRSCKYLFLRSWWQQEDIDGLIKSEEQAKAAAKERGEEYESTWDLDALRQVRDVQSSKDQKAMTPEEEDKGVETTAVELVTALQVGVGANFYTINPASKKIVRTKKNKDPRGKMPVDWFYGDIDGTNPLGRGIVELLGGLQNLIDSDMQAYQYNRALALQPPVIKKGNLGNFRFEPNAVIEDVDGNGDIVVLKVDTSALVNYPQLYGLQKSQLLNLVSSPDTSISAEVGNPGFSKTPTGINQQKAVISVDDNTIRKQFEAWFEAWSETAINLYFAERSGTEIIQLDDETADKLRKLADDGKFDPSLINEEDQIIVNYDEVTPALKFRVDSSTSKMADEQAQLAGLEMLNQAIDTSQVLQSIVPPENILSLWNRLVAVSGVEDPEDMRVDVKEYKQQQMLAQQQAMQQQAQQQQAMQGQSVQPQQLPPEDMQIIDNLRRLGAPDAVIQQVIDMANQGASLEQIQAFLQQGGQLGRV